MQSRRICIVPALRRSVLAILVLVLGHLASWAHEGATRHVRCAQHGELVDAPRLARAEATGSWLIAVEGDGDDEHCSLAAGIHSTIATTTHDLVVATLASETAIAPLRSVETHVDFRIAPKTSPPVC